MAFRPTPISWSKSLGLKWQRNSSTMYQQLHNCPQARSILQPLSNASRMAQTTQPMKQQQQQQAQPINQRRYFSYYYYQFPKIPRPKRSVFYYSTWSRSGSNNGGNLGGGGAYGPMMNGNRSYYRFTRFPFPRISKNCFHQQIKRLKTKLKRFKNVSFQKKLEQEGNKEGNLSSGGP